MRSYGGHHDQALSGWGMAGGVIVMALAVLLPFVIVAVVVATVAGAAAFLVACVVVFIKELVKLIKEG